MEEEVQEVLYVSKESFYRFVERYARDTRDIDNDTRFAFVALPS
jgi:hypothetical protein